MLDAPSIQLTPVWFQLISTGINISLLIVGIRLVRQFSRIELKVDTMWGVFMKRYGTSEDKVRHNYAD